MLSIEQKNERNKMNGNVFICTLLVLILFAGLALRLWQVQVLQASKHHRRVAWQSIRPVRMNPVRGRIYSSDGVLLVGNRSVYDIVFHPAEMRQAGGKTFSYIMSCMDRLSVWIGRQPELKENDVRNHFFYRPALPFTVFRNLDEEELCRIWELEPWIGGMEVVARNVRDYRKPGMLSQTLGFTSRVMPDNEYAGTDYSRMYIQADQKGSSGLEYVYNRELAGTPGAKLVRIDPLGYAHEELPGTIPVSNGMDLMLTIDSRAQEIGERILEGYKGALVLLDVETGAVLAMVSKPGFSLDQLTAASYRYMDKEDKNMPLLNRAVNAKYAPGSIVKPIIGMAALECGAITPEWRHNCIGYITIGNLRIHCAKRSGHGVLDVYDAITVSCNPFFMEAGKHTKLKNLQPMFQAAGIGQKTGIDYQEYVSGLCPSRKAAWDLYKRDWLPVDTLYCSIGQGLIQVTPLQIAVYCAALANGGKLLRPFLVQEIRDGDGQIVRRNSMSIRRQLPVSANHLEVIRSAMANVVESDSGSGKLLRDVKRKNPQTGEDERVYLAAKTGTAEVGPKDDRHKDTWMIVYGPLPEPKFAFACVVERGESGGKTVGPIAHDFWNEWMKLQN